MTTVSVTELADEIQRLFAQQDADRDQARSVFAQLRDALSTGRVRAAEPDPSAATGWRVNTWVKQGILLGFRSVLTGIAVEVQAPHGVGRCRMLPLADASAASLHPFVTDHVEAARDGHHRWLAGLQRAREARLRP